VITGVESELLPPSSMACRNQAVSVTAFRDALDGVLRAEATVTNSMSKPLPVVVPGAVTRNLAPETTRGVSAPGSTVRRVNADRSMASGLQSHQTPRFAWGLTPCALARQGPQNRIAVGGHFQL